MKRTLILVAAGIIIILIGVMITLHTLIGQSVKENISIAQQKYSGTTEDALISYLLDEDNSIYNRTHLAIWTLGQIKSEKVLPILKEYYRDDPEGNTCYGKHDFMLCQYEIYKALNAIEKKRQLTHQRLK